MTLNEAPTQHPYQHPDGRLDFLGGGGDMGALMRAHRWETTPLGAPDTWPQSLRTSVRILLNTRHPMFIWWGPELIQFYNDAYRRTLGPERHPSALGQSGRECWAEIWDIIGPQIDLVMAGRGATWHEDHLVPITRYGRREDVWWTYGFSPIDDETKPDGVGGVLVVCNDVTEAHRATEALRVNKERLQLALDAGVVGIWDWHIPEDRVFADARFAGLYGVDPALAATGAPVNLFLRNMHPDDRERVNRETALAIASAGNFSSEYRLVQNDGSVRWVLARGYCLHDDQGRPVRFPGATVDITERKEAEEHRRLLTDELNHRVKNTLATVQALANQTFRDGVLPATARAAFNARLRALSDAQDVLTGARRAVADLLAIVKSAVEAFAEGATRFRIEGPAVNLAPRNALALALALHELCTNAAKYGALSIPGGHIDITWHIEPSASGDDLLALRWAERGGPPVTPPAQKGFGTRLVESSLAGELGADVQIVYHPDGVVCTMRAPLQRVQQDISPIAAPSRM